MSLADLAFQGKYARAVSQKAEGTVRKSACPLCKLPGSKNRYKIKLRSIGYRLVYEVVDGELIVLVIAVGKRDRSEIYERARSR